MSDRIQPAYLLLGPESGDKGQWIKECRAGLREQYGTDPEIHRFYPFETENGEVLTALGNNSLFADHRLVILSQAEDLSATQITQLAGYLAHPSQSATLLIVSNETSLSAKLSSALSKDQVKVFWEMYDDRKPDWVRAFFRKSNMAIQDEAIELLLELVENNTQELKNTCSQLIQFLAANHTGFADPITEDDIENYVFHSRQESVFSLFEQIATGTLEKALAVLHTLLRSGEGDSVPLLAGLLWQFRRLASFTELLGQGNGTDQAYKNTTVLGKNAALRRKKDQNTYTVATQRYTLAQIRSIIARLGEYDIRTREMGTDFQQLLLEEFLYVCMEKQGEAPAALPRASFATDARF